MPDYFPFIYQFPKRCIALSALSNSDLEGLFFGGERCVNRNLWT